MDPHVARLPQPGVSRLRQTTEAEWPEHKLTSCFALLACSDLAELSFMDYGCVEMKIVIDMPIAKRATRIAKLMQ